MTTKTEPKTISSSARAAQPAARPRRLRRSAAVRELVRENEVTPADLILPLFVVPDSRKRVEIRSMPGVFQNRVGDAVIEAEEGWRHGIRAVLLFGIPEKKDEFGSSSWDPHGPVQQAIRAIREAVPEMVIIADVCLCEYTSHGHCGVIVERNGQRDVDNDATLELLAKQSVAFAEAGADFVAPSDMMDGRVAAIRSALDASGHSGTGVISYAAKFASGFYGPFREAAESAPQFGDRRTYQMDPANGAEALREIELDIAEGADMVMVKPAMAFLDIVRAAKDRFNTPMVVYNVSGEYAMVKAAAEKGWIDGERIMNELLLSMKRAGADLIITYHALEFARQFSR